jgi:hypothetical protein
MYVHLSTSQFFRKLCMSRSVSPHLNSKCTAQHGQKHIKDNKTKYAELTAQRTSLHVNMDRRAMQK